MRALPRAATLCLATMLIWPLSAAARVLVARDFPARVEAAVAAGTLDRAQADLYWVYALRAPERLPTEYLVTVPEGEAARRAMRAGGSALVLRCGTPALRAVLGRLDRLPAAVRAEVRELLSWSRVTGADAERRAAQEAILGQIETANFTIAWNPDTVTNEDGTPVGPGDLDAQGVPESVRQWASYLEASFDEIAQILSPGTPEAAYLGTTLATAKIPVLVDALGSGLYGVTDAVTDQTGALLPILTLNTDLSFAPANDVGRETGSARENARAAMKATAAHELFHAVQFVYYGAGRLLQIDFPDDWWLEASATWVEDEVFDEVNDYVQYFAGVGGASGTGGWADFVEQGLLVDTQSSPSSRIYGGVIFPKYLSEHVGGRDSMGALWDLIRGGGFALAALDEYGRAVGFDDASGLPGLDGLYLGFAGSNAYLEEEYEEGGMGYGEVPLRGSLPAAPGAELRVTADRPTFLGTTYRESVGAGAAVELSLTDSPPLSDWGVSVALKRGSGQGVVVLASSGLGGAPSAVLGSFGATDGARLGASLLVDVQARDFSLAAAALALPDTTPPSTPGALTAVAVAGGIDASWTANVADVDVAGYVVQVSGTAGSTFVRSRAVLAPVTSIEVRELPAGTYDLAVRAYDRSGNEGPAQISAAILVGAAVPLATPAPSITLVRAPLSSRDVAERGEGSRGIGTKFGVERLCFLGALGL